MVIPTPETAVRLAGRSRATVRALVEWARRGTMDHLAVSFFVDRPEGIMARHLVRVLGLILLVGAGVASRAQADWMNLTGAETAPNIAEITIEDDRVRLALEVYIEDLETFYDLVPDDWLTDTAAERPALEERLRRFAAETFRFVTDAGVALRARLRLAEPRLRKDRFSPFAGMINPTTRQRVPEPPEDKRVLYAEIEYPFAERPKSLTIVPPLDEAGVALVNTGFIAYHKAVPIIDFRYLSAPATVNLNWDDPWYSRFESPGLKRHHKSALMSFLYVEPNEVRHEMLTRIRDLEQWMDLGLGSRDSIEPEEWDGLMARVGAFLLTKNPVVIDGEPAEPTLARANFVTVGLRGIQVIEEPQRLDVSTAILGVILAYETDGMPQEVTVDWELFTDQIQRVPATTIDPAGPFISYADPDDRIIAWQNHLIDYRPPTFEAVPLGPGHRLRLPLAALALILLSIAAGGLAVKPRLAPRKVWIGAAVAGLVGAGLLSSVAVYEFRNPFAGPPGDEAATKIVAQLAENLHNALQLRDESELQDAIAISVARQTLDEVLPEARRALAIEIQGGGVARVESVDEVVVQDIESLGGGGFRVLSEWRADASAGHWGHLHQRRMRFSALMEMQPVESAWKLTGLTVVDVRQE